MFWSDYCLLIVENRGGNKWYGWEGSPGNAKKYPDLADMEGNEEKSKEDGGGSGRDGERVPTEPRGNAVQREREAK